MRRLFLGPCRERVHVQTVLGTLQGAGVCADCSRDLAGSGCMCRLFSGPCRERVHAQTVLGALQGAGLFAIGKSGAIMAIDPGREDSMKMDEP